MKLSEYTKNNDIELTEEQVSKLNEVLGVKKSKVWKPKYEEDFYYICAGDIGDSAWQGSHNDIGLWEMNEVFKTKEQAEFELEKRKLLVELERFAKENNDEIDWKNEDQEKFFIYFNSGRWELDIYYYWSTQTMNNIYFSSNELAEQAVEKFGDRIKKYLFGVEE